MRQVILILLFLSFCFSCQKSGDLANGNPILKEIPTPCGQGGEANLFASETGQVYLSWIEYENDTTDALMFSTLKHKKWSTPRKISSGSDWFVNWADFPSLVAYQDKGQSLAAHWLQKSASATYDYDVRIAQSRDGGNTWEPSFIPYQDGIPAEHGFVSLLPLSEENIFATWLDGRNTKGHGHDDAGAQEQYGAMTLRAAVFDKDGNLFEEAELDKRVCDCCQTSAAMTDQGIIVAYRDRSENEVRDIAIIRQVDGEWTSPKLVFEDNWTIAGCPVNGPAISASGEYVALAWYNNAEDKPQVKVAFSKDSGASFDTPIRVDHGQPLGRVGILMLSGEMALVSWLEKEEEQASIYAAKVSRSGKVGESIMVSRTQASRSSGFPVMAKTREDIIFAWTNADSLSVVRTAMMPLKRIY